MNAIEIKNLCKAYKEFEIKDFNLTLPGGYILGLIGENGAGKSTIIKMLLDIVKKDSGSISLLGKDSSDLRLAKEDIGVVLDEIGINDCFNAVNVGKMMKRIYKNWDMKKYYSLLKDFSVPDNKKFKDLSKGMKMKLGIAVALSHNPKLLILDEVTAGLDPVIRDEITDVFLEFTRDEEHSILISSHIVSDLEKMCDYIAFIHNGRLMLFEEKDALRDDYATMNCTESEANNIDASAVMGRRSTPYSTQLLVKKSLIPQSFETSPVSIEELFVFMIRGDKR